MFPCPLLLFPWNSEKNKKKPKIEKIMQNEKKLDWIDDSNVPEKKYCASFNFFILFDLSEAEQEYAP